MQHNKNILMHRATFLAALLVGGCASNSAQTARVSAEAWTTTWGASSTLPTPGSPSFNNQTLRVIAHVSVAGDQARVRIANTFGTRPLLIDKASIALQQSGAALAAGSNRELTFSGRRSIVIPIGAYVVSDPAPLAISARGDVAVSIFTSGDTGPVTAHPLALQTSFVSGPGDFVLSDDAAPFVTSLSAWPFLVGIEVHAAKGTQTIVAFGDSITDGYGSTTGTNHRWPDYLERRLLDAHQKAAVVNEGIGGNRILHDALAVTPFFGPNGLARFDRDALSISGVSHIVVMLGINDIGHAGAGKNSQEAVSADDIIAGLKQFALRAHARGIKIIGATLNPYAGAAYFDQQGEEKRLKVNAWIRSTADFDGFIDFDAATRDPNKPGQLQAAYDSGDHLHPNDAGYEAMAQSIKLSLFD
jgi:lysophospholipase L1-like esterase